MTQTERDQFSSKEFVIVVMLLNSIPSCQRSEPKGYITSLKRGKKNTGKGQKMKYLAFLRSHRCDNTYHWEKVWFSGQECESM